MLVLKKYKIERPETVEIYNFNMGGVYLCYTMLSTYRIKQKSSKYYIHIIYYCVGTSITNSWLIHHRHIAQQNITKNQQYTLFQFQSLIANSLGLTEKATSITKCSRSKPSLKSSFDETIKKRMLPRVSLLIDNTCLDSIDHLPHFPEKQELLQNE